MNEKENLLKQLAEIEQKYKPCNEEKDSINFFKAMYKGTEEVELHSRFIAFLLSPTSSHKQDDFLRLFVRDILKIKEDDFDLNNCEVYPNEQDRREYEKIDILLINGKQAIIIENKIHADDSNIDESVRDVKLGYRGQLERYYHTIETGEDRHDNKLKYKRGNIHMFYLSLYKKPTLQSLGTLIEKKIAVPVIEYKDVIPKWLELCKNAAKNEFLKTIIEQYRSFVIEIASDNDKALEITNLIAENENYWKYAENIPLEQLKHVKWHTVHRFFKELKDKLNDKFTDIQIPTDDEITEITHKKGKEIKISFKTSDDTQLYICSDINGLTLGNLTKEKWGYLDSDKFPNISKINFCKFSNEETFHIINNDYRKNIIKEIAEKVTEQYDKVNRIFEKIKSLSE